MPNSQPTLSTRQRVLAHLAEHHVASARSLSRAWGLTRADIRYHLNTMLAEGIIEPAPRTPGGPPRPGRPEQFYRLVAGSAPNNLPALCGALLLALDDLVGDGSETALRAAAANLPAAPSPQSSAVQRLNDAVAQLNQMGYHARWEAGPTGPRVLLHACPYAAVTAAHPRVCAIDRYFLERITGLSLAHTQRINFATGRPSACIFSARPGLFGD